MKRPKVSRHEATGLLLVASLAIIRLAMLLITEEDPASSWLFLVCVLLAMGCSLLVLLGE